MGKSKRDKTTGLPIPSPVVPLTSICLRIDVPNAIEYRSALKGALASLGQAWTWAQTEGQDNQASYQAAELWRSRIQDAIYTLDCGESPMSCADVADCIENNPAVQQAIQNVVPTTPVDGQTYPPGVPLTPGQMTARLNEIDECAFNPFWAQVEQYVDFMVNLGQDVLEQIAAYSAALDAGENIPMGQFLGKLKNASTAGKVVEFLQWALTTVKAAYESADTTANRNTIKCAIFCENRDSCLITLDGTLNTLNARLGGLLSPGDLTDLPSMVTAFTTSAFNPTLALDLWILFLMGSAKTAGMFGLQNIDETLNMVLALAVNDANNDWELLCDECDEPPPSDCQEFSLDDYNWYPQPGGWGVRDSGGLAGQLYIPDGLYYFDWTWFQNAGAWTEIEVEFNQSVTGFELMYNGSQIMYRNTGVIGTSFKATEFTKAVGVPFPFINAGAWSLRPTIAGRTVPASLRVVRICLTEA